MATVEAQCEPCMGTGVFRGFAEPPGLGLVCNRCNGSGKMELTYVPFTGRQQRDDVDFVARADHGFPPNLEGKIYYEEFLEGKMP